MSKVVRVQGGDYKIVVGSETVPGDIYLDTNPAGLIGAQGKVTITGDLEVLGNTVTISSETLTVTDNIVYLNVGETASGVASIGPTSGIQIDRGLLTDVSVLWDERIDAFVFVNSNYTSTSTLSTSIQTIATNRINTGGANLELITTGNGVITVTGTTNYEENVLDFGRLFTILNILSVARTGNTATITTTTPHGLVVSKQADVVCTSNASFNGTFVEILSVPTSTSFTFSNTGINLSVTPATGTVKPVPILDDDYIPNMRAMAEFTNAALLAFSPDKIQTNDTKVQTYDADITGISEITFNVDGVEQASISNNGLTVDNIRINNNSITNFSSDNLLLDSVLNLANRVTTPSTPVGYVKVYSKVNPGTGGTGLYFVDTTGTNDELISKTKALLYSLIL